MISLHSGVIIHRVNLMLCWRAFSVKGFGISGIDPLQKIWRLHSFLIAAVTNYHTFSRLKITEMYYLTVLEVRCLTWVSLALIKVSAGMHPSQGSKAESGSRDKLSW